MLLTDEPNETFTPVLTSLLWKCTKEHCGYQWPATVSSVMNPSKKSGCPKCNRTTINLTNAKRHKNQWLREYGQVYVLKCQEEKDNEVFYKIGVTIRDIKQRVREIPYECEVLAAIQTNKHDMYYIEEELHDINSTTSYLPKKEFNGKTECFSSVIGF